MKSGKRRYTLKARGEQMAETRARIVEAIMQLHQEVGPSQTTVSAIAEKAGVERLTVYRHFSNEAEMLAACSHRYFELNPPPNPTAWKAELDPVSRTKRGLADLYAFYGRTAPMFEKVYRDVGLSDATKNVVARFDEHVRGMADVMAAAWPRDQVAARRRLILRHAAKFATWQSLEAEDVSDQEKVALLLDWVSA